MDLMKLMLVSAWAQDIGQQPAANPKDINQVGQTFLSLGLALTMLVGFLFLAAALFLIPIVVSWYRERRILREGDLPPSGRSPA